MMDLKLRAEVEKYSIAMGEAEKTAKIIFASRLDLFPKSTGFNLDQEGFADPEESRYKEVEFGNIPFLKTLQDIELYENDSHSPVPDFSFKHTCFSKAETVFKKIGGEEVAVYELFVEKHGIKQIGYSGAEVVEKGDIENELQKT